MSKCENVELLSENIAESEGGSFTDIHELEAKIDELKRASAAKSEFLLRMSHDIRTPMNAIIGMTAIAAANIDDKARVLDSLQKISISSKHLLELINEILDMSKIESGKLELTEAPFNISELAKSLAEMITPETDEREQELTVSIDDIKHEVAVGDSQLLQQALMNLLSNAYKYTPKGGKISFSVSELPNPRPQYANYQFVVDDNGVGMSKKFMEHLFEPFERCEDERVNNEQGTGLGMAITSSIIEMMDGTIDVESEPDKGTRFTVSLKLELQDSDVSDSYSGELATTDVDSLLLQATMKNYQKLDLSDKRVLLAEDNEINSEIAIEILKMTGITVDHAWNGKEAVDMMNDSEDGFYDLVFMDIQMPVMNGYDATRAIRASDREYNKTIPIIAMSANAFKEDVKASLAAGMDEHISKPIDFDMLLNNMQKWLKDK